jgi:Fe-S oxidoreductase
VPLKKKHEHFRLEDIARPTPQWAHVEDSDLMPLPAPLDNPDSEPAWRSLGDEKRGKYEASLDDTLVLDVPKPQTREEEEQLTRRFLEGLAKLFSRQDNWPFLRPLILTMELCTNCQTCSSACHIFEASGQSPIYRPTCRAEILRRIYFDYIKPGGKFFGKWRNGAIDLNWRTVARLAELAYRCNLCRRCAQACPMGADNALVARELRKLFSQEMGIHTKELHDKGTVLQLKVGSSTGMNPQVVRDNLDFIDEEMSEKTGLTIKTPWDKVGADILLVHNAGEVLAWPDNPGAFSVLFQQAGVSWTLSSEALDGLGYDGVTYGLFYDDFMLAKVVLKHAQAAKKLGVKKMVFGECGHANKAMSIVADRILTGDLNIRRESSMPLLRDIVLNGGLSFDPRRNDFPVTLHDPCNLTRMMGIVEPQRQVLRKLCPQFREMTPHGVNNYCCGGGSGFAIHSRHNFEDWRLKIAGRKKLSQVLKAFADCLDPSIRKYLCAPCSNCKGQFREMLRYYALTRNYNIHYGGMVELIVNAMTDVRPGFVEWA